MSGGDHRPWLILSRSEAVALQQAAMASLESARGIREPSRTLARAFRVLDLQLAYIDGGADGEEPSIRGALLREDFHYGE